MSETPPLRPKFLDAKPEDPVTYDGDPIHDKVPEFSGTDFMEEAPKPNKPLKSRHKEVARLHALGKTNNEIAKKVHYTAAWVSLLLASVPVQEEVDRYRNRLFEQDLLSAMKDLGGDAVRVMEELIRDPNIKIKDRADGAKWLLEKLTGKPKQEVNVESNTLGAFMEMLKQMSSAGDSLSAPTIDVTPERAALPQPTTNSKFTKWVDEEI